VTNAVERLALSARAYAKLVRIARTLADLDAAPAIRPSDVAEAISYRVLDRTAVAGPASAA
jgi:magnesium chelatase family protein